MTTSSDSRDDTPPWQDAQLGLLGGFQLHRDGTPVSLSSGGQRLLALLALLGARSRTAAASQLWPDASEARAAGNLRSTIWRVSRIWPGLVEAGDQRLQLAPSVTVDSREFLLRIRAVAHGHNPWAEKPDCPGVPELLPGWFDDWVLDERDRIRQLALQVLELLSDRELGRLRYGAALEAAMEAVRAEPLRESAHRAVIRVHLAQGNRAQALTTLARLTDLFRRELGVAPSPLTQRLFQQADVPAARQAPTTPANGTRSAPDTTLATTAEGVSGRT